MNYIGSLTQEEKTILCEMITGRAFRELFKKNEREFQKIQKGFRAKSLSEQLALSIAIANVDKPFVAVYLNEMVDILIVKIQASIETLENQGLTQDAAFATTILDSAFSNNTDLYIKLIGKEMDTNDRSKLHEKMKAIQFEREMKAEVSDRIKAIEEEKRQMLDQVELAQQNIEKLKSEYEQRIHEIEQERDALKVSLVEAQSRMTELQSIPATVNGNDADYLSRFDDTDSSLLPAAGSDNIVSLCGVISDDYKGQKCLKRYADLSYDGYYHIFHKNEEISPYFANRDKIFNKDGPSADDFYGIWTWSTTPNVNDSSKDYVSSQYDINLDAIEIVFIQDTSNLDELVKLLNNGIECQPHSRKTMFTFYVSKGQYKGVLCNARELNAVNGKITFAEDCVEAPVYEFSKDEILRLDNGLSFYKNAFAGCPKEIYKLKSSLDIVKNIVCSSISWATYKARGATRAEYKTFKDFLSVIPTHDIISRIETVCHCSSSAAQELLDEFLRSVGRYVDGDSIEDEIILSAISAKTELQERTKALIRADWEAENKHLFAEAQEKLDSFNIQLESATVSLSEAQASLERTKAQEERLNGIIAEKEKLAEDVEVAVSERIQKARKNAADFIASMAFVGGQSIQVAEASAAAEASFKIPYHSFSALTDINDLEAHHSWADVINTATFELGEAGVTEKYRRSLAAFLCAAYIEKQPILLIGPNAIDIVQAFSATVTSHKYGILCCEGSYSDQAIAEIGADGEDIVIINNLLASGWMNRLPEILSKKDIFYVATHPYVEDIQVEAKSLYGFMLPLFTEFFVDKKATGEYYGGYFAEDFKTGSIPKEIHKDVRTLSKLKIGSLVRNRINRLVAAAHYIYDALTVDEEFLFAVLPIAYASLEMNALTAVLADPQKGITISEGLKRELQYVLGEF